nr:MotA/TolQ/ExbB proton channel family protein [Shimia sp. CNT1-13L.2]
MAPTAFAQETAPTVPTASPEIAQPAQPVLTAETSGAALPTAPETPAELTNNPVDATSDDQSSLVSSDVALSLEAQPLSEEVGETTEEPSEPATEPTLFEHEAAQRVEKFLRDGGPSIWAISALSVITVALILWKIWHLALIGAWSRGKAVNALARWETGGGTAAFSIVEKRRGLRSQVVAAAIKARLTHNEDTAREETSRVAKNSLADAGSGLRALELIATIAPLLGLLGTVLGMIAAFQALQESGSRADPALLAGGIWEALLTTAAGMAVAIPASAALTWFESVIDRMRRDVEDAAARIFIAPLPAGDTQAGSLAAE